MSSAANGLEEHGKKRKQEDEGQTQERSGKKAKKDSERKSDEQAELQSTLMKTADSAVGRRDSEDKKKTRRRKKSKKRRPSTGNTTALITHDPHDNGTVKKKSRREVRRERGETAASTDVQIASNENDKSGSSNKFTLSPPSAGRFLHHDPIFVRDDEGDDFLLSATDREMQLLSLDTSLAVGTHAAPDDSSILCYAVDSIDRNLVHVGYSDGSISSWNRMDYVSTTRQVSASGTFTAMASSAGTEKEKCILYYIMDLGRQSAVFGQDEKLFETEQQLHDIQVLGDNDYIVVRGDAVVIIGRKKDNYQSVKDFDWIELPLRTASTCADARLVHSQPNKKASKQRPGLSLAVGNLDGQIHLFDDLSFLFRQQTNRTLPSPRILHWHREAVSSVKFSRDGNYLISGGRETVLVIWQLATGKRQYLPHLTSEIQRIVVNPEGDRYALQMGDNSIMVISTSELKPVANFAGLQLLSGRAKGNNQARPAAVLHPINHNQLLLTVPSSQPNSRKDITSRPFLQTFDTRTSRHITRQALTRNNVTDFNIGPDRTPIVPPDVKLLAISHDGMWLATVDEWVPPASDLQHLASDPADLEIEQQRRREVYLKIWSWDEEQALWTLTTRMDAPHRRANGDVMGTGVVMALVADPSSTGFATVGEDLSVKIWKPKSSARSRARGLIEWTCKRSIQVLNNTERADSPIDKSSQFDSGHACLAYSTDGSILAVALAGQVASEAPVVYFINASSGAITTKSGLTTAEITSMAFIERYFIAVSGPAAYVWDLVDDALVNTIKLSSGQKRAAHQLSVNPVDKTFALVTPRRLAGLTRVQIYHVQKLGCVYSEEFETRVEAILAGKNARGFTLLFSNATIRTILPRGAAPIQVRSSLFAQGSEQLDTAIQPSAMEAVDEDMPDMLHASDLSEFAKQDVVAANDMEDDRPVVRPEQLANIFDVGQSFAMPPVKDMFHAVMDLFSRKPITRMQPAEA